MSVAPSGAKKLTLGGAVLAAIAASSCCLGPLVLGALGLGGVGATAAVAAYRPYLLAATAALLAGGFYLTYRKPRAVGADSCGCEKPRASRAGRVSLWIASALVILFAASPPLLAAITHGAAVPAGVGPVEHAVIEVQGLDCEACASPIRRALAKVGGLRDLSLDIKAQSVAVSYEPAPNRLEAYVASINALGYEASLPSHPLAAGEK